MTARKVSLLLGVPLCVAGLALLAGTGTSTLPAAAGGAAPPQKKKAIVFSAHVLECPARGPLGQPHGLDTMAAGAVAHDFATAWWEHNRQAALALSDPGFRTKARALTQGPRQPPPGVTVSRVTGIGHLRVAGGIAARCGVALLPAIRVVTVRVLHGGTVTAGIYVIRRPRGYLVWAVR